jgi:hypothetical protein
VGDAAAVDIRNMGNELMAHGGVENLTAAADTEDRQPGFECRFGKPDLEDVTAGLVLVVRLSLGARAMGGVDVLMPASMRPSRCGRYASASLSSTQGMTRGIPPARMT